MIKFLIIGPLTLLEYLINFSFSLYSEVLSKSYMYVYFFKEIFLFIWPYLGPVQLLLFPFYTNLIWALRLLNKRSSLVRTQSVKKWFLLNILSRSRKHNLKSLSWRTDYEYRCFHLEMYGLRWFKGDFSQVLTPITWKWGWIF